MADETFFLKLTARAHTWPTLRTRDQHTLSRELMSVVLEAEASDAILLAHQVDPRDLALRPGLDGWGPERVETILAELVERRAVEVLGDGRIRHLPSYEGLRAKRLRAAYMRGLRDARAARDAAEIHDTEDEAAEYHRGYLAGASTPGAGSLARPPGPGGGDVSEPDETPTVARAAQARPRRPKIGWDPSTGSFTHLDDVRLRELAKKYPQVADIPAEVDACARWHATAGTDMRSPGGRLATWLSRATQDSRPATRGRAEPSTGPGPDEYDEDGRLITGGGR